MSYRVSAWGASVALAVSVSTALSAQDRPTCTLRAEAGWRRNEQVAAIPRDRSRLQVEQELLARARQALVGEASGVQVSGAVMRSRAETMEQGRSASYSDVYLEMFRQSTEGRIVEERPPCYGAAGDSLRIVLLARVQVDSAAAAVGFDVSVATDQPAYREGDRIEVAVESSDAARVYLFAVTSDGSATLFFPNRYDTLNVLRPNEARYVPGRSGAPYSLVAELTPNLGSTHAEMVLAVFYRGRAGQPFALTDAFSRKFTLAEINRVLLTVPRRDRVEAMSGYEIRAKDERGADR